jgi:hypothetical protein
VIVVTGRVQIPAQNRTRFVEIAGAMCRASRAEEAPDALFHTVAATRRLDPARGLVDAPA